MIGFGQLAGTELSAIVWIPDRTTLRVPIWFGPVVVLAKSKDGSPAQLQLRISAKPPSADRFERFESAGLTFIRAPSHTATPITGDPEIDATFRYIAALKQTLPSGTRTSITALDREFKRELSRFRPLSRPYFNQTSVPINGGTSHNHAEETWTLLKPGQQATIPDSGNPMRIEVRIPRRVHTRLSILRDGKTLRILDKTLSNSGRREAWSTPTHFRFPASSPPSPLLVDAEQGTALVRAFRFARTPYFFDRRSLPTQSRTGQGRTKGTPKSPALTSLLAAPTQDSHYSDSFAKARNAELSARQLFAASQPSPPTAAQLKRVAQLFKAVPAELAAPLYRNLLSRLWRRSIQLSNVPSALEGDPNNVHPEDLIAIKGLSSLISNTPLDSSLATAAQLDSWLTNHTSQRLKRVTKALFRRGGSLTSVPINNAQDSRLQFGPVLGGLETSDTCSIRGPYGTRWTRIDKPSCLEVATTNGTHTLVSIRSEQAPGGVEASVSIDGTQVHIHGSVGLPGRAAIRPGLHCFNPSVPIFARVPRTGRTACTELRDASRQYLITGSVDVSLPVRPAASYLSLQLQAEPVRTVQSEQSVRRDLSVTIGAKQYPVWTSSKHPTSLKFPLPASESSVRLETRTPRWVRLLTRIVSKPEATPRPISLQRDSYSPDEMNLDITRLRRLSKQLLTTHPGDERSGLLIQRSAILGRIGQVSLALSDSQEAEEQKTANTPLPTTSEASSLAPTGAELSAAAPDVVVVGYASKIAPIQGPISAERIAKIRHWLRDGFTAADAIGFFEHHAPPSSAEALLWAIFSQRALLPLYGADALVAMGRHFGDGQAIARAVKLRTDDLEQRKRTRVDFEKALLQTWGLLHEAESLGGSTSKSKGRLRTLITYHKPTTVAGTAGRALVELADEDTKQLGEKGAETSDPISIGLRARRALTLASDDSTYVSPNRRIVIRDETLPMLTLTGRCHDPRLNEPDSGEPDEREACRIVATVNGRPVRCQSIGPSPNTPTRRTSSLTQCKLRLPPGSNRIEGYFSGSPSAFGWMAAYDGSGRAIRRRTVTEWHEIDDERPMTFSLLGPTVLRVAARSMQSKSQSIKIVFKNRKVEPITQVLNQERDQRAHLFVPGRPGATGGPKTAPTLGEPTVHNLVIPYEGPVTLTLAIDHGRALVSPSIAVPSDGAHLVREKANDELATAPLLNVKPGPSRYALSLRQTVPYAPPTVGNITNRGLVSLTGSVSLVGRDLMEGDHDQPGTYLASRVSARRELSPGYVWMRASVLARERFRGESFGADALLQWRTSAGTDAKGAGTDTSILGDFIPGGFVRGRVVGQSIANIAGSNLTGIGANLHTGLRWSIPISPHWKMLPTVSGSLKRTEGRLSDTANVDPDVYSAWAHDNPRTLDLKLSHLHNAYLDLVLLYSTSMRLTRDLSHLDRVQTTAVLEALPFGDLPIWFKFRSQLGYRPKTHSRLHPFSRVGMKMSGGTFHWLSPKYRFSIQGDVSFRMDLGATGLSDSTTFAGLSLRLDFLPGTGLSDFTPGERRFRSAMEAGASLTKAVPKTTPENWMPPHVP